MNSPDYPVLIFVALVALLWAAHRIDRWMSRRRAHAHRAYLRAKLLDSLRRDLARVTGQRDRYLALYHEAVKVNAALLGRFGGDNPLALGAEATVAARALNADERAWDDEVWA